MKLEDLYKIKEVVEREIEKMEKNKEAQRKFVAKNGVPKRKTLNERIKELESKLSK